MLNGLDNVEITFKNLKVNKNALFDASFKDIS